MQSQTMRLRTCCMRHHVLPTRLLADNKHILVAKQTTHSIDQPFRSTASIISLKKDFEFDFFNGRFLKSKCFSEEILPENRYAVFTEKGDFCGEVYLENNKIKYGFVIQKEG